MDKDRGRGTGVRPALNVLFWFVVCLFVLSLAFTIIGSAMNHDGLLGAGIVGWLATSFLLFAWLVLWMWVRTKTYEE